MKNKLLYMLVVLAGVFFTAASCTFEVKVSGVELAGTKNGTFEGSHETPLVKASVLVTISGEKMTDIQIIRHENGKGQKAEEIVSVVLEKQTTKVDAVSGATLSSKVILKSIENAVESAR